MDLPPLGALRAFALVAETGSLTAAGARLNLTQPAISRRIRELEVVLGVALVHRGANALRLTEEGARYAAALNQAFGDIATATAALRGATPLRIRAYTTWALRWLIPRLPRFRALHPGQEVEVMTGTDPAVDFAREGLDAAIRTAPADRPPARGAVRLQPVLVAPFAAPRRGAAKVAPRRGAAKVAPRRGAAKADRGRLEGMSLLGSRIRPRDWALWHQAAGLPPPAAPLLFESTTLAIQAAAEGLGAVICSPAFVEEEVRRRRLARLSRVEAETGDHYWLMLPPGTPTPRAAALRDWLLAEAAPPTRASDP